VSERAKKSHALDNAVTLMDDVISAFFLKYRSFGRRGFLSETVGLGNDKYVRVHANHFHCFIDIRLFDLYRREE
jgi:hypothetical protein